MKFELKDDYIELYKLIKVMDLAQSGGHAKILIEEEHVKRNGEIELENEPKLFLVKL